MLAGEVHDLAREMLQALSVNEAALREAPPPRAVPPPDLTSARNELTRRLAKLDETYEADAFTPAERALHRKALLAELEALNHVRASPRASSPAAGGGLAGHPAGRT